MGEKERAWAEIQKINANRDLTPTDKHLAMKSVRSLSKTIDGLIGREKERISDNYES